MQRRSDPKTARIEIPWGSTGTSQTASNLSGASQGTVRPNPHPDVSADLEDRASDEVLTAYEVLAFHAYKATGSKFDLICINEGDVMYFKPEACSLEELRTVSMDLYLAFDTNFHTNNPDQIVKVGRLEHRSIHLNSEQSTVPTHDHSLGDSLVVPVRLLSGYKLGAPNRTAFPCDECIRDRMRCELDMGVPCRRCDAKGRNCTVNGHTKQQHYDALMHEERHRAPYIFEQPGGNGSLVALLSRNGYAYLQRLNKHFVKVGVPIRISAQLIVDQMNKMPDASLHKTLYAMMSSSSHSSIYAQ